MEDQLTNEQRNRLLKLSSEIRLDKITISFSIDGRDVNGRKRSTFYSVTASRGAGAEVEGFHQDSTAASYTVEDARIVRCLVSKHVVSSVYNDAVFRGILSVNEAKEELLSVIASYDAQIARILTSKGSAK